MTGPVILDAGPSLNFLSLHKERLLLSALGGYVMAPETVQREVLRKARAEARFARTTRVWQTLVVAGRLTVLSDDPTDQLVAAANRIGIADLPLRQRQAMDLGEVMVTCHGSVLAERGESVSIVMDDGAGTRVAAAEAARLDRVRATTNPNVGSIMLISTPLILEARRGTADIPDRAAMRSLYEQLRGLDSGLPHIDTTTLV